MKELKKKFIETRDTWRDLMDNVNWYVFGEEELDEDIFADAMRGALELFSQMYKSKTVPVLGNPQELGVNDLINLFGMMADYSADRYTEESENITFRASQIATRLLLCGVKENYFWLEDGIFPVKDFIDGFCFEPGKDYVYDINKGDLSDIIDMLENN